MTGQRDDHMWYFLKNVISLTWTSFSLFLLPRDLVQEKKTTTLSITDGKDVFASLEQPKIVFCCSLVSKEQYYFSSVKKIHIFLISYRGRQPSEWACSLCSPTWSPEGLLLLRPAVKYAESACGRRMQQDAAPSFPENLDTEQRRHVPIKLTYYRCYPAWPAGQGQRFKSCHRNKGHGHCHTNVRLDVMQ